MFSRKARKRIAIAGAFCLLLLILASPAHAFDGRTGDEVVIGAGEVIDDDLYVSANTVRIDGTVKGDLIAVGSTVDINGTVEGDLIAGGQAVTLSGSVADDVRIAGMALTIRDGARVGDDLVSAGWSLESRSGSVVGGEAIFFGSQATLSGSVAQDLRVSANALELAGVVGGDVEADVGTAEDAAPFTPFMFMPDAPSMPSVPGGLNIRQGAEIGGDLTYTSAAEGAIATGTVIGRISHRKPLVEIAATEAEPAPTPTDRVLTWLGENLRALVVLLAVGSLLVWVIPGWTGQLAEAIRQRPLPSLGWGVVSIVAFVVAVLLIVLVMVLLGVVFGTLTLGSLTGTVVWLGLLSLFALSVIFGLTIGYVTKIVVGYCGGRMLLSRINPDWAESRFWPLLIGLVIVLLLTAIPWVGGLINLIIVLLGLGAVWLYGWNLLRRPPETPELGAV